MTPQCQEWIGFCVEKYPCKGKVLEVGSFDVNGSPRQHFKNDKFTEYVGIDMREGPSVDRVMNSQQMDFSDDSFDVIVDAERMEHDNRFWVTIKEQFRVCRPGGHIIITTRSWGSFPPHDYPNDYWRFMDSGLRDLLEYAGFECLATAYGERCQVGDRAVFAIGRKPLQVGKERPFSIVIPSANPVNLIACIAAIVQHEPQFPTERIIVVDDGSREKAESRLPKVTWIQGKKPFIFSRNVNLGIRRADSDVLVLNDDAILQTPMGFTRMSRVAKGLVSAAIKGFVGNGNQSAKTIGLRSDPGTLHFVCIFIPKAVQDSTGLLDERFIGYGYEDNDYSRRTIEAGFPLQVFDGCVVEHEHFKSVWRSDPSWVGLMAKNKKLYEEKYSSLAAKS